MKYEVEKFSTFLQENSMEFDRVKKGDSTIEQIKSDFQKLSEYYIKEQITFRKVFSTIEEGKTIIKEHKELFDIIIRLVNEEKQARAFGKNIILQQINNKVSEEYETIIGFLDFCTKIRGEE